MKYTLHKLAYNPSTQKTNFFSEPRSFPLEGAGAEPAELLPLARVPLRPFPLPVQVHARLQRLLVVVLQLQVLVLQLLVQVGQPLHLVLPLLCE